MAETLSTTVPDDLDGERLDRAVAVLGEMSRATARRAVEAGEVTVDGQVVGNGRSRVSAGQILVLPPPALEADLVPEPVEFETVYVDEHVLVVDKPAGLVVHPGAGRDEGTLAAGILHRHPQVGGVGQPGRWGIVHRLDRDTSGLMVVALTSDAYHDLVRLIASRRVEREYLALVDGVFAVPTGTIEAPLSRDPSRPTRQKVDPAGRPAVTHYSVEETYPEYGASLLRVRLETGRTHQIRVHLAAIDHSLVGDRVYRSGPDRVASPRVFLHATRLSFTHPVSGEEARFDSPLPPDLTAVLDQLT